MRFFFALMLLVAAAWTFSSCSSASGSAMFCDTVCVNDTMKFQNTEHPLEPFVYISAKDCGPDSIGRGFSNGITRKLSFSSLVSGATLKINPSKVSGFAGDTSYAYLLFNDCITGRGYSIKLPYGSNGTLKVLASAINHHDPKFSVEKGLLAYSDRGNILLEDMTTGQEATMTFGQIVEIDYDKIHNFIDSVNITRERVWARVKLGDEWKELEKKISFK